MSKLQQILTYLESEKLDVAVVSGPRHNQLPHWLLQ